MVTTPAKQAKKPSQLFSRRDLLRWLYLARMTMVTGILVAALVQWLVASQQSTLVATVMFLVALGFTSWSFWRTHMRAKEPGENFLYAQVILDVLLVTGVVHVTGGSDSPFPPLYILVVSAGALLLPLPGGVLIGALASMVYFADLVWGYQESFGWLVFLQTGLFALVALLSGLLGDQLRGTGLALGATQSELRQLQLDTGDILANLVTGILTVDGEGRLAYANPAAESLLGLSGAEWLGRPVVDEVEHRAPGMGLGIERSIRERHGVPRFRAVLERDGRALGIQTAVLERGTELPPSATAIFQDITDLERMEALNRRTERLEAVATLSASLAHEIKNPLASIRSAVEQLSRGSLEDEDRAVLQRLVLNESDRLSRLLSEFLDYSILRIGPRQSVDLAGVARDSIALLRQHPEAESVDVTLEGSGDPVSVHGDPDLLHRMLFNLLLNGVQHAGPGGQVVVSVEDVRRPNPRGTGIRHPVALTVRDSGPGVPPEAVEKIFDPFYSTRAGGSGLGLAMVERAVEAHAGAVFVDRAREGGAQFVVYLPASDGSKGAEDQ